MQILKNLTHALCRSLTVIVSLTLLLSQSSFSQWTLQSTVPEIGVWPAISVYAPDGVVIAGGSSNDAKVYKSTNGGINWTNITGTLVGTPNLISVWATDGNTIFVGDGGGPNGIGGNAKVWKTTNGGQNWTNILSTGGTAAYINGIVFSRTMPSFGIIESDPPDGTGQPYWIAKTTNYGNNWTVTSAPGIVNSVSSDHTVFVIDSMFYGFGIFSGANAYITTNGGNNWNNRALNITGNYTTGLAFSSDKTYGISVSNSSLPMISNSSNAGQIWTSINTYTNLTGISRAKWVYGTPICFITAESGSTGTIMENYNNGSGWWVTQTSIINSINDLDLVNVSGNIYAYAISSSGGIIRLQQQITGTSPVSNIPSQYILSQNFPNPFNPSTSISFSLPEDSRVSIFIYDIRGRIVHELTNKDYKDGTYELTWDASNYPSGVYFYRLKTGGYTETKKMTLLK